MSLRSAVVGILAGFAAAPRPHLSWRGVLLFIGATVAATGVADAASLVAALPDVHLGPVLTETFLAPFTKAAGIPVTVLAFDGTLDAARAGHADVAVLDGPTLFDGCKNGVLAKLDWAKLGGRERQLPQTASDCGLGALLTSTVLAWNRDKFSGMPTWAEFWDVAKVPGKRGLHHGARYNLEIALLADGVAPGDVYAALRTDAGVERAFRKLDQLKPYLVWWTEAGEAPRLLASGDVLMTSAPADRIVTAARSGDPGAHHTFALQWAGNVTDVESWAVLAGSPAAAHAARLLTFAADPKVQRGLPALGGFGGAASGANDKLPADLLAVSPSTPANLASGLMVDEGFWHDNAGKLDKQFEAWMAK